MPKRKSRVEKMLIQSLTEAVEFARGERGIEYISQSSQKIGDVSVTFTVGRIGPRNQNPIKKPIR